MDSKELVAYFSKMGKKGGNITKKKYGLKHYEEIGRLGAIKRWKPKP